MYYEIYILFLSSSGASQHCIEESRHAGTKVWQAELSHRR